MPYTVYDSSKVVVMLDGVEVTGFMDGAVIKVEQTNDVVTALEDLHGLASLAVSQSKLGSGEFTLSQTSPSLHRCLEVYNRRELVPFWVHSNNSVSEKAGGAHAMIVKAPAVEYGPEISGRTFKLLIMDYETTD